MIKMRVSYIKGQRKIICDIPKSHIWSDLTVEYVINILKQSIVEKDNLQSFIVFCSNELLMVQLILWDVNTGISLGQGKAARIFGGCAAGSEKPHCCEQHGHQSCNDLVTDLGNNLINDLEM